METIGKRISELRKKKGLTQVELGDLLHVSDKTISSWESNRTEPGLSDIVELSDIIDTTSSYLLYGDIKRLDIETEIKIKITESEYNYLNAYMKNSGKFLKSINQIDTYYNPINRSFIEDDEITEWLRIGERGGKIILNYKNWYQNTYCDEYEVELDNKENMERILTILGLEKIAVVNKMRNSYMYLEKYEVALDKVESLGYYIEIEVKKYDEENNPIKEYDNLLRIAKNLNLDLNNIDKRGYPYHLIRKGKAID